MNINIDGKTKLISVILIVFTVYSVACQEPRSKPIKEVLREPLPSEDITCIESETTIIVQGPTFRYSLDKLSGTITEIEVVREGEVVIKQVSPLDVVIDKEKSSSNFSGMTRIEHLSKNMIVAVTEGKWDSGLLSTIRTTFYNDGVVVSQYTLKPESDVILSEGIRQDLTVKGKFSHYLHKRRDTHGFDCYQGAIPEVGKTTRLYTPTSCLEAYSNECAIAMFTDMGDYYRSPSELDACAISTNAIDENKNVQIYLHQHIIHVGEKGKKYVLRKGEPFSFRIGIAVAPNRLPHPRRHDLRMFIWIGDEKYPYPTDEEIQTVARMGFTLFQMHRLGPPGIPRPPEGELERVIKTVHDTGMLFIWTENADLLYAHDPEVVKKMNEGKWVEWEGFNYGGRYTASMDSFCDLVATCLASPNGLADYRVESIRRMLGKYPVDGMYIDDNLAYANCTRWKEHNHPQEVYDCLIELHEVNWRRREALKEKVPHLVLIDHCSKAFILPVIAPFDMHLFGEGYDLGSIEEFRATFGSFSNMYAQGCLYAGDDEEERCPVESAYIFDLLTGGGQYCSIDWRIWSEKFPYARGVSPTEAEKIKRYNLIQYYFGLYESSSPIELPTSTPNIYAVLYSNSVWKDYLLVVANRNESARTTNIISLNEQFRGACSKFAVVDVIEKRVISPSVEDVEDIFQNLSINPNQMKIFYIRDVSMMRPYHLWGAKRLLERWDANEHILTLELDFPPGFEEGLENEVIILENNCSLRKVVVNGKKLSCRVLKDFISVEANE